MASPTKEELMQRARERYRRVNPDDPYGEPAFAASGGRTATGGGTGAGVTAAMDQSPTPAFGPPPNPNAGMDPLSGFAARYNPAMLDQIYENPWYAISDAVPGAQPSSPLYQSLRDMGGDPLTLYNIIQGSRQKIDGGAEDFTNWLAGVYGNQARRGGQDFDANQLIQTLFGQTKFGDQSQNTLGQILGAGDMATQVRTLFNMVRDASNVGMNPLAARGYQAAIAQAGDRYGNAAMRDTAGTGASAMNPTQWIAQNAPWLAGR